jgi:hypothetical protein
VRRRHPARPAEGAPALTPPRAPRRPSSRRSFPPP